MLASSRILRKSRPNAVALSGNQEPDTDFTNPQTGGTSFSQIDSEGNGDIARLKLRFINHQRLWSLRPRERFLTAQQGDLR